MTVPTRWSASTSSPPGSDDEARRLATTQQMSFANIFRGARGLSQPPIDDIESYWSPAEKAQAMSMLAALHRRLARYGSFRHRCARRGNRRRRTHDRVRCLRSRHAAALLRTHRQRRWDRLLTLSFARRATSRLLEFHFAPQPGVPETDIALRHARSQPWEASLTTIAEFRIFWRQFCAWRNVPFAGVPFCATTGRSRNGHRPSTRLKGQPCTKRRSTRAIAEFRRSPWLGFGYAPRWRRHESVPESTYMTAFRISHRSD